MPTFTFNMEEFSLGFLSYIRRAAGELKLCRSVLSCLGISLDFGDAIGYDENIQHPEAAEAVE